MGSVLRIHDAVAQIRIAGINALVDDEFEYAQEPVTTGDVSLQTADFEAFVRTLAGRRAATPGRSEPAASTMSSPTEVPRTTSPVAVTIPLEKTQGASAVMPVIIGTGGLYLLMLPLYFLASHVPEEGLMLLKGGGFLVIVVVLSVLLLKWKKIAAYFSKRMSLEIDQGEVRLVNPKYEALPASCPIDAIRIEPCLFSYQNKGFSMRVPAIRLTVADINRSQSGPSMGLFPGDRPSIPSHVGAPLMFSPSPTGAASYTGWA
ncbi:MAG: hypothetical protein ACNA8W_10190 [Bradymonadaceae bacterium]